MKHSHTLAVAVMLGMACPAMAGPPVRTHTEHHASAEAHAEVSAGPDGNKSSYQKQSVTVTSDGKQTIRKTVTVRDGKEEVVTEITDALGKVIRRTGDEKSGDETRKPGGQDHQGDGPWLGVRVQAAQPALRDQLGLEEDEGVVVEVLAPDGPAAKAGIKVNDIFLKLDEVKLSTPEDLRSELDQRAVGETVNLNVLRKGVRKDVGVVLEEKPQDDAGKQDNPPPPADAGRNGGKSSKEEIRVEVKDGHASASATAGAGLDDVLNDPDVPENFKKSVREMRDKMREFEKKHGIKGDAAAE